MKLSVSKRNQPIQEIDLGSNVLSQDYSETVFLIGRSKDCHIILDDKKISREHVRVIHKSGKWFMEKTSLDNTCHINGDDFDRHELEEGDVLTVESFSVTVTPSDESKITTHSNISSTALPIQQAQGVVAQTPIVKTEVTALPKDDDTNDFTNATVIDTSRTKNTTATDLSVLSTPSIEEEIAKDADFESVEFEDKNTTGKMDTSAFEEELVGKLETKESSEEAVVESDYDFDSPLGSDHGAQETIDSEFLSEEEQELEIEASIALSNSEGSDDMSSYSLENIDNDNESTRVIQSFASTYLELFGDTAPYDKFILESDKTFIGRDPKKCQIVLNDTEVSTVHAVLTKNSIMITLEDLNSSNGTLYKGDRINKVILGHNDEFVIGGVTFTLKIKSEFLKDESATLMAVDENQTVEVEEVIEVEAEEGEQLDALGQSVEAGPEEKSIIKRVWKDEQKRKKAIYVLVALVAAWVMFGDEEPAPVAPKAQSTKTKEVKNTVANTSMKKLSEEQRRSLSALYEIGKDHYQNGRYREALSELQKVAVVDPNFNSSLQSLIALSKEGLSKIEEEEKKRQAEIIAAEKKAKVKLLLEKAREYTKDRRVDLATVTFNDITQLDPENLEVTRMKMELEDWQSEKAKKELEELQKKKDREDKVEKLKPGRTLYLQKEWFKAISRLEDFLRVKDMDDDLTTEATTMLKTSRDELNAAIAPLVGKAKSLLEGQDLKGAYEVYQQILRIDPSHAEALNQMGDIKEQLSNRARKVYREAIIAESLSLFQDAKEKFQEVQQISPVDSDYYKKASDKLKDYLE